MAATQLQACAEGVHTPVTAYARPSGWSFHFAAIYLVANEAFPEDERVWQHIDVARQQVCFERILEQTTFTRIEWLVLSASAQLWARRSAGAWVDIVAQQLGEYLALVLHLRAERSRRDGESVATSYRPLDTGS